MIYTFTTIVVLGIFLAGIFAYLLYQEDQKPPD